MTLPLEMSDLSEIDALLQQGVAAHQQKRYEDAERCYRTIIQSQPTNPDANHNLGILAVSFNHIEAALTLFKTAINANPKTEQFWLSYINTLIKTSQLDEARNALDQGKMQGISDENVEALTTQIQSLSQIPNNASSEQPSQAEVDRLLKYYQQGEFEQAESLALSMTENFPNYSFGWKALGVSSARLGKEHKALHACQKAVEFDPIDPQNFSNLGSVYQSVNMFDEAERCFRQAIEIDEGYPEAHANLGFTLLEVGRLDEAESSFRQAILLRKDFAEAYNNLGITLKRLGRLSEAESVYRQAICLNEGYAAAHNNLGILLKEIGEYEAAKDCFDNTILLDSNFSDAFINQACVLNFQGRTDEAEISLLDAIAFRPDFAEAHTNLGMLYLQQLNFARGFELCEWRWQTEQYLGEQLTSSKPTWSGEAGKSVFIWSEQGVGDTLMFSTILSELQDICSSIIMRCDKRLIPLFERSFSGNISFVPDKSIVSEDDYDYQIAIGSLPKLFRNDLESFKKGAKGFLRADPDRIQHLKNILQADTQQPLCGISWRGGKQELVHSKSIDLALLAQSLSDKNYRLVNLQYDATTEELEELKTNHGIEVINVAEVDNFHDLDGLAALLSACDKVVSVANTTVHLAGTLGVQTDVLLSFAHDWRWGGDSSASYWYDALTLYRQEYINNWQQPLEALRIPR